MAIRILIPSFAVVATAIVVANSTANRTTARLFDNVHWTVAYTTSAALAWLGALSASPNDARPKRWFALALTAYALGQVLWDIQVAIGWNPFPGPSDLLFICLGPMTSFGWMTLLLRGKHRSEHRTMLLDSGGLCLAVLALTLAMYLPRRGGTALLPLSFLVAYPVALCWGTSATLTAVLALKLHPSRGLVLFLFGLLLNSGLWLEWNSLTLDDALSDGTLFNALFSLGALAQGSGVLLLRMDPAGSANWERFCEGTSRLLPLLLVVLSAAAVVLAFTLPAVPGPMRWSALAGALAVVAIATLRQSLLLQERERLVEAERALRKAEENFRVLVEQASDGIFIANVDGIYTDVNSSGAEMLAMRRDEVIGKHISDVVEEGNRVTPELERLLRGETVRSMWTFRRKDESTFQGEVTAKQLPDGRLQGFVRDASERLELEARLRQSQKMEAMGVLAAGIAHDFNNLLTAIRGNVSLALLDVGAEHPAAGPLTDIEQAGQRATELVRGILAFSRPRRPASAPVQLNLLVEEVAKLLRPTLPANIDFDVTLPARSPVVEAEPGQIHQVLMNLCMNAWHAIGSGGGRIRIDLELYQHRGDSSLDLPVGVYAHLSVADTGQGMSKAVQERIFEPFFTTKAPGEGTGLGLSVAYGIARAHRGALTVARSFPQQGSTFALYLPISSSTVEKPAPERSISSRPTRARTRVACVDDERQVLSVTVRVLERRGYVVRGFESACELLTELGSGRAEYDVIVSDYNMPRMSGLELARAVFALNLPIGFVLTSGYMSDQLRSAAAEVGITRLVSKPDSLERIYDAIEDVKPTQESPRETA